MCIRKKKNLFCSQQSISFFSSFLKKQTSDAWKTQIAPHQHLDTHTHTHIPHTTRSLIHRPKSTGEVQMRSIARAVAGAAALAAITLAGMVLLATTRTATVLDNKDSIAQTFSGQLVSVPATLVRYDEGTTFSPQGFFENSAIDKSARLQELAVQQTKNLKKASIPWGKTFASNQLMHFKSVHFNPLNPKGFNAKKAAVLQRLKEQAKMNREQEKKFGRPRRYRLPAYKSLQDMLSMNEFFTRSNLKETKKKSNNVIYLTYIYIYIMYILGPAHCCSSHVYLSVICYIYAYYLYILGPEGGEEAKEGGGNEAEGGEEKNGEESPPIQTQATHLWRARRERRRT